MPSPPRQKSEGWVPAHPPKSSNNTPDLPQKPRRRNNPQDKIPNSYGHAFVLINQKRDQDWKVSYSLWKCSACDLLRRKASLLICDSPMQGGCRHTVYGWGSLTGPRGIHWQNPCHLSQCDGGDVRRRIGKGKHPHQERAKYDAIM
jgi:hypothetical protein